MQMFINFVIVKKNALQSYKIMFWENSVRGMEFKARENKIWGKESKNEKEVQGRILWCARCQDDKRACHPRRRRGKGSAPLYVWQRERHKGQSVHHQNI